MERWTIRAAGAGKYFAHINSSGPYPSSLGKFDYQYGFDIAVEGIEVVHPTVIDQMTRAHFPSIQKGIERGHGFLEEHGELVTSLRIEIVQIRQHPPDPDLLGSSHGMSLLVGLLNDQGIADEPMDASWRTTAVVALARRVLEERDFFVLPVLADALEDAGCDDADILNHCRSAGPHDRGCWVVDAILGKK